MTRNHITTFFLLATMTALLFAIGYGIAGQTGLMIAIVLALLGNVATYWYADRIVLRVYNAQPFPTESAADKEIHAVLAKLCEIMKLPVPKLYHLNNKMPNAFATGRNPENAAVAVTQGLIDLLKPAELRAVIAHELAHIKNRDVLIGSIAATLATAIGYLTDMIRWSLFWGGRGTTEKRRGSGVSLMVLALLTPFMAMLIQLAISRSREYAADACSGAECGDPLALADALLALEKAKATQYEPASTAQATVASLFFVYPFRSRGLYNLFATHPPIKDRVKRLQALLEDR